MSNDQSHEFRVNDLTTAVETLLQKVIDKLKASASAEEDAGGRLFFPDGIQLISVKVKVPPAEAELTIAGEKGIKPTDARLGVTALGEHHDRDVDDGGHNDPPWHGTDVITWHNRHPYPVSITFDDPSPLDYPNPFTIQGRGDVHTIILVSAHGEYPYHVAHFIHGEFHMVAGDPKIIIQ